MFRGDFTLSPTSNIWCNFPAAFASSFPFLLLNTTAGSSPFESEVSQQPPGGPEEAGCVRVTPKAQFLCVISECRRDPRRCRQASASTRRCLIVFSSSFQQKWNSSRERVKLNKKVSSFSPKSGRCRCGRTRHRREPSGVKVKTDGCMFVCVRARRCF